MPKPVVILSALEGVERQIVLSFLKNPEPVSHPDTSTQYYKGQISTNAGLIDVILGRTNQTNPNAGIETERAIAAFQPQYVFFVGVAGGLKDSKIGDIVLGEEVFGYERGKTTDTGFNARPTSAKSSYKLEQLANTYAHSAEWKLKAASLHNTSFKGPVEMISGVIVSGEKVDASEKSNLHLFLKEHFNHAQAVEMEGLAFLEACRHHPTVEGLLIRGISDLVSGKGDADAEGSQPYATRNAATFAFGLIEALYAQPASAKKLSLEDQKQLATLATQLYPRGILDNQIWVEAGGDASAIATSSNGKTQWREAITKISNGGGGNITFLSLMEAMFEENSGNDNLRELLQKIK
ncbi:MAG: effector-associated domain EAD1-containing protein [Janthinobacterium lividum]